MYLSKSDFKVARTCATKLYYKKLGYPSVRDDDESLRFLADGGYMIEAIAKLLHPEGVEIGFEGKLRAEGGRRLLFLARKLFQQAPQALRRLVAIESARGDVDDEAFPLVDWKFLAREQMIGLEKNETGGERGALVAIDEGMVAAKVEEVSRGDFDRI